MNRQATFRIECNAPMYGPLLPEAGRNQIDVNERSLAVVMAAKSVTIPVGCEIRVIHVPSGEVLFRKSAEL